MVCVCVSRMIQTFPTTSYNPVVVGFDAEWRPSRNKCPRSKVSLIQISHGDFTLLCHIANMGFVLFSLFSIFRSRGVPCIYQDLFPIRSSIYLKILELLRCNCIVASTKLLLYLYYSRLELRSFKIN